MTEEDRKRADEAYADKSIRMSSIVCCKCWHVGRLLICRKCGHHICMGCKEPS